MLGPGFVGSNCKIVGYCKKTGAPITQRPAVIEAKKWIQGALKKRKTKEGPRGEGTLTAQAKAAGKTPAEFCASSAGKKGIAAKRCNMRNNLMKSAK
jgi:hypothetical protein